ncbi:MAG TPA: RNA methyltransferase [Gemmatimonadales bacterium]|nr:RNA methyltransferase [Gemmatimonadales bacterium]
MIVIVLHEPQELVNIAHVVRAMMNFAVGDLRLVAPREYDPRRIEGIAHRSAELVARIRVVDDLDAALADAIHVVGFTARERTAKRNVLRPREALAEALERAAAGPTALLFGREDAGLSNRALDRCHRVVTIPADSAYPSLNLAHAVVVALYELALARGDGERAFKPARRRAAPATAEQLERLFADAEAALRAAGFFKSHVEEPVLRTLREIAHRTPLDAREAKLLRAMALEIARGRRTPRAARRVD